MYKNFQNNISLTIYITTLFFVLCGLNLFKKIKNKYIRLGLNTTIFGFSAFIIIYYTQTVVETFVSGEKGREQIQNIINALEGLEIPEDLLNQCDIEFANQEDITSSFPNSDEPIDQLKKLIHLSVTGSLIDQSVLYDAIIRYHEINQNSNGDKTEQFLELDPKCLHWLTLWIEAFGFILPPYNPTDSNMEPMFTYNNVFVNEDIPRVDFFASGTMGERLLNQIRLDSGASAEIQAYINDMTFNQFKTIRCGLVDNIRGMYNQEITPATNLIDDLNDHKRNIEIITSVETLDYISSSKSQEEQFEDQLEPEINSLLEVLNDLNQLTRKKYQDYYNEFTSSSYPPNFVSISDNINYIRSI
jgi:hypothetical protein